MTTCEIRHVDVVAGKGWQCEVYSDYGVCNACHQIGGGTSHPHKLTNHPSWDERDAHSKQARERRVLQVHSPWPLM